MADKKRKGGRVTPPGGTGGAAAGGKPSPSSAGGSRLPKKIGPFARPDPEAPLGQVGRRPSSPAKLLIFGLVWIGCGITAFFVIKSGLKIVIGVVFIGVGLLWLRGAATAAARRSSPPARPDDR